MGTRNRERLLSASPVPEHFAPGARQGAALCLATARTPARAAPPRPLTKLGGEAQHTEKAAVFYYSKVKDGFLLAHFPLSPWFGANFAKQRHKVTFDLH